MSKITTAAELVEHLFTNGLEGRATHLVLFDGNANNLGVWKESAVLAKVEELVESVKQTKSRKSEPDGCELVAHDTGDGWALAVENKDRDVIAYLKWPEAWPETMTAGELKAKGFLIV